MPRSLSDRREADCREIARQSGGRLGSVVVVLVALHFDLGFVLGSGSGSGSGSGAQCLRFGLALIMFLVLLLLPQRALRLDAVSQKHWLGNASQLFPAQSHRQIGGRFAAAEADWRGLNSQLKSFSTCSSAAHGDRIPVYNVGRQSFVENCAVADDLSIRFRFGP